MKSNEELVYAVGVNPAQAVVNDRDPVTMSPTVRSKRALALSAKVVSPLGYLALLLTGNHEGGGEEVY